MGIFRIAQAYGESVRPHHRRRRPYQAGALEATKAGLVHPRKGCLVNSLYHYPSNMTFFSLPKDPEIGGIPFVSNNVKLHQAGGAGILQACGHFNKLRIHLRKRLRSARQRKGYAVITTKSKYSTRYIIIATGFYDIPVLMRVPGGTSQSDALLQGPAFYAMQHVLVVGANNFAVDAALEFRKGRNSDDGDRENGSVGVVKYWVKPVIENRIKKEACRRSSIPLSGEIRNTEWISARRTVWITI